MDHKAFQTLIETVRKLHSDNVALREKIQQLEGQTEDAGQQYFVASKRRDKFHLPSCEWAPFFMESGDFLEFYSHEEAVEACYKPCGTCRA